jgi:hypothetical protein
MRTAPTDEFTLTVTTLAVALLPQPLDKTKHMATSASQMPRRLVILRNLIPTISPTQLRSANLPPALELFILRKKPFNIIHPGLKPHRRS